MKKLKQLCLLALLVLFSASCSRIVHPDYELMATGKIITIDTRNQCLAIHSEETGSSTWFVSRPNVDNLSLYGLHYSEALTYDDVVNIYRHGTEFIVTKYNIDDAKAVNSALCDYYWKNLKNHWLELIIILGIVACVVCYCEDVFTVLMVIAVGCCSMLFITNTGSTLSPVGNGNIIRITDTYVILDNALSVPYATLDDIANKTPVELGNKVWLYSYTMSNVKTEQIFFSTHKLDDNVLKKSQIYPENLLMTLVLFWTLTLLAQIPLYYLEKHREKRTPPQC